MNSELAFLEGAAGEGAMCGFAELMGHVIGLYTFGESCSVSASEGRRIVSSILYVMGLASDDDAPEVASRLARGNVIETWTARRAILEARVDAVMRTWREAVATMPPIRNIALRDTLASIGELPARYDTFFAAHEVPCSIDYPLSAPVPESLKGLDYLETWLRQLLVEVRFLARFDVGEMEAYLQSWCPDYRGLLVNLHDPIRQAWGTGALREKR